MRLENSHLIVGLLGPFFVSLSETRRPTRRLMLRFPADQIHDEDAALDWWENEFAPFCESLRGHFDSALLVRMMVASIREIRSASLEELITIIEAARETGYSARQIRRWLKDGKISNLGTDASPRVRRKDVINHKKTSLPRRSPIRIMDTAQDIARSVANS